MYYSHATWYFFTSTLSDSKSAPQNLPPSKLQSIFRGQEKKAATQIHGPAVYGISESIVILQSRKNLGPRRLKPWTFRHLSFFSFFVSTGSRFRNRLGGPVVFLVPVDYVLVKHSQVTAGQVADYWLPLLLSLDSSPQYILTSQQSQYRTAYPPCCDWGKVAHCWFDKGDQIGISEPDMGTQKKIFYLYYLLYCFGVRQGSSVRI